MDILRFWAPFGDLGAMYDYHLRLIGQHVGVFLLVLIVLFLLGVTAEVLRANIGSKSGDGWPKISGRMVRPTSSQKTRLNDLSYDMKIWTDISTILSQCMRLTDRRTDIILIAGPHLHSMQRSKNSVFEQKFEALNKICLVELMWWCRLNGQNWQEWLNLLIWRSQHCWRLTVPVMHRHQVAVRTLMILQQILHAAVIHVRKLVHLWGLYRIPVLAVVCAHIYNINVKNKVYNNGYRRRSCTSKAAKIHCFVRFVMYYFITTVPVAFYCARSDEIVHYKSKETVNFCG